MEKKKSGADHESNRSYPGRIDSLRRFTSSFGHMRECLMLSFLAILVLLIYSNTLEFHFIFDDWPNILKNPHIRLTGFTLEGIKEAVLESPCLNRPVANISFALNYYFHQSNVMGYHLVNILIHITTGIFLYFFVKTTLNIPLLHSRYGSHKWIPFFTVFIWLIHPIQTQSVTYIVQRMNSMAAMFYILSFLLYAKARLSEEKKKKWILFACCILAGILALGSKEIAATLPFFIFLYEWYFFQDLNWPWLKRYLFRFSWLLIFLAFVVFIYLGAHPLDRILSGYDGRDFTLIQRVLTEFRVVIYYISLFIFPHPSRLNLDYDFPLSHSLVDPVTTLLSMGAIAVLIGLAFYLAKKERLLSFCILWFLGNLVMESSVVGLEIIFEHRTYLPSMFVSLMVVTLAYRYIKPEWLVVALLCAATILCSVWTYERNNVWSNELSLWKDCVEKSPKKARPHNNLGLALSRQGKLDEAIAHYQEALRIAPNFERAYYNMGVVLARQGRIEEAISHFLEALRINPGYARPHHNLGVVLLNQGKVDEAISHFLEALRIDSDYAEAHYSLGVVLARQGRIEEAIPHFREALRIDPDYSEAYYNLGVVLARHGRMGEAITHFREVLRIEPGCVKAHSNLGVALMRQGRIDEAIVHFREALRIKPDYAAAYKNLQGALNIKKGSH